MDRFKIVCFAVAAGALIGAPIALVATGPYRMQSDLQKAFEADDRTAIHHRVDIDSIRESVSEQLSNHMIADHLKTRNDESIIGAAPFYREMAGFLTNTVIDIRHLKNAMTGGYVFTDSGDMTGVFTDHGSQKAKYEYAGKYAGFGEYHVKATKIDDPNVNFTIVMRLQPNLIWKVVDVVDIPDFTLAINSKTPAPAPASVSAPQPEAPVESYVEQRNREMGITYPVVATPTNHPEVMLVGTDTEVPYVIGSYDGSVICMMYPKSTQCHIDGEREVFCNETGCTERANTNPPQWARTISGVDRSGNTFSVPDAHRCTASLKAVECTGSRMPDLVARSKK